MPGFHDTRKRHQGKVQGGACTWGTCLDKPDGGRMCRLHRERVRSNVEAARRKHLQAVALKRAQADDDADEGPMPGLKPLDFVPCARCGLRGHAPGDPDRCLFGSATRGLGGMQASQTVSRRAAGQR